MGDHGADSWAELHCHSAFSLLDGARLPEDLVQRAAALGYSALALTDHDSLAGLVRHAQACQAHGIRPIAGVELSLTDGSHLTLLARDAIGYRSLCRLVSQAQLAGEKGAPLATLDDMATCGAGLECLTGCRRGRISAALLRGDTQGARAALDDLTAVFGRAHTWVEVQIAGLPDDRLLAFGLTQLARRAGVGLVATGNTHYAEAGDRNLQDVLVCIRERRPLTQARPYLRPGASWHLRSPAEMALRFAGLPGALRDTVELATRCGFALDHIDSRLPSFPVPDGHTADSYLRMLVSDGARARYGREAESDAVHGRLAHELGVISQLGMADYMLIVWDIVEFTRGQGILCQGRGSAVGSAVCYCLGITAVEPLYHRLSFERFLALGRTDPPDIDLDLPADRGDGRPAREAVIQYVLRRYAGHAALVATHITFRARSAIRDVGMVLGLAPAQIDTLARSVEWSLSGGSTVAMGDTVPISPMARRLADLCARLDGLPRHLGQHPGGIVLTARPLAEVAPVERARMPGRLIVQFDKDAAELSGMVKIDLLGLGMLSVIDECLTHIAQQEGQTIPLHGFRCDDPAIYDLLCAADTVGVFQVESRAQMSACLPQLQPRCLDDLTVAVAIIRPGPIQGNATHPYLRRRQGLEPVIYPGGEPGRRLLEPILGETLGVCLYQDQVIEIGRACGLDAGEAAELRRAMSSARGGERMARLRDRLERTLAVHGLDRPAREAVLIMVQAFSGYGFIKGHAAAFGYLAYVSAWLKVHHPAVFCAALLNGQPMGFYPPEVVVQDAERHGVGVLPVDVRHSRVRCAVAGGAVRLGLGLVRGLGGEAATRLEAVMHGESPPGSLEDLCERACLDEEDARALARSGALCGFVPDRRQALWRAPVVAKAARARWLPALMAAVDTSVALPALTAEEERDLDYHALGLAPGRHVLASLRPQLALWARWDLAAVSALPRGMGVDLAGQSICLQRPPTAKGVVFLALSDESGLLNVMVPPAVYARDRATIRGEALLWVRGVVERRGKATTVRAIQVRPLAALLANTHPTGDAVPGMAP